LDAVFNVTAQHLNERAAQARHFNDKEYVAKVLCEPQPIQEAIAKARNNAFTATATALSALMSANQDIRSWEFPHADDRRWLADIRCCIIDAEWLLGEGKFTDAYSNLLDAIHRLHWLLYERRYGSDRPTRQPPTRAVLDAAAKILERLGTAADHVQNLSGAAHG
jgi:hypothetical protein